MASLDPQSQPRSRAVFVVGAGRSGTSALMRGVHALGVSLGDNLKAATGKNPTGFFENADLLDVAKRARSALGLKSESVALIPEAAWREVDLEPLVKETVALVERSFGGAPIWGFKYAQTLRMLPFWERVFELGRIDASYVVAARNPLSVARSRAKLDSQRGVQEMSDLSWLVNVVPYFRRMARRPFTVVDYDVLMGGPGEQLTRIAEQLDLPVDEAVGFAIREYSEEFLQTEMRHTAFTDDDLESDPSLNPLVRDAYRWLRRLATGRGGAPVFRALDGLGPHREGRRRARPRALSRRPPRERAASHAPATHRPPALALDEDAPPDTLGEVLRLGARTYRELMRGRSGCPCPA